MISKFFWKVCEYLTFDDAFFIGVCLTKTACVMTIFGVVGYIIHNIVHSQINTFFPFPTFWIPESFLGVVSTVMIYYVGFLVCYISKDLRNKMRYF